MRVLPGSVLVAALVTLATGCGGAFAGSASVAGPRIPLAPPGVYVPDDVAAGYAVYGDALAPEGRWSGDASYGVHWCPARGGAEEPSFQPYVSRGHWSTSEGVEYGAAPGTPYWQSDGSARWLEITTHHGWWVDVGDPAARFGRWCWVPGAEETPARVVWRSDDELVGWAPEPPIWIDDGDECAAAAFVWTFELLGTLLEDAVDGYVLPPEQMDLAMEATAPSRRPAGDGPTFSRRAPAKPIVGAARQGLLAYVAAHPTLGPATSAGSGGGTPSTSGGSKDKEGSSVRVAIGPERLPPASLLMTMMLTDPPMGPGGVARFGGLAPATGSSGSSGSYASSASAPSSPLTHVRSGWASRGAASSPASTRAWGSGPAVHAASSYSSHSSSSGSSGGGSHASTSSGSSHHGKK